MTNEDNEDFEKSTKCWICDNDCIGRDVEGRDHYHITGKYRSSAHWDCNVNVRLNHKILAVFHNLQNYGPHLIMQGLDKFNLKIPRGLEKYMSFSVNNKLVFIDSIQLLSSSLDSLVKKLWKDYFTY